jgi:hypothetical protein
MESMLVERYDNENSFSLLRLYCHVSPSVTWFLSNGAGRKLNIVSRNIGSFNRVVSQIFHNMAGIDEPVHDHLSFGNYEWSDAILSDRW